MPEHEPKPSAPARPAIPAANASDAHDVTFEEYAQGMGRANLPLAQALRVTLGLSSDTAKTKTFKRGYLNAALKKLTGGTT